MESASLTRSLSKVKDKISSKFRSESVSQDDEHVLKAMKYDDTAPSTTSSGPSLLSPSASSTPSTSSSSTALSNATLTTSTSSTSLVSATTNPSLRQNSVQESRSSSVVLMECIPETSLLDSTTTHKRSTSQSTNHSDLRHQLVMTAPGDLPMSSLQSSRKTSLDDNKEDQLLEQLLPPPPLINSTSPHITTELSSPFGRLSPPMSPISQKLRNSSIVCDPLENIATVLHGSSVPSNSISEETVTSVNDFADAMALSILDKVDENTDSNTEWKI